MVTSTNTETKRSAGRPKYNPIIPNGKFTFHDFKILNGINPETDQGLRCTSLTLRNYLKRDESLNDNSIIVKLQGVFAVPESGLGRKRDVYIRRDELHTIDSVEASPEASPESTLEAAVAKAPDVEISMNDQTVPSTKETDEDDSGFIQHSEQDILDAKEESDHLMKYEELKQSLLGSDPVPAELIQAN